MGRAHRLALYPYTKHTPLIVVLSVKWERSDSATVRKHILSILESLVESQISGFKKKTHKRKVYVQWTAENAQGKAFRKLAQFTPSYHLMFACPRSICPPLPQCVRESSAVITPRNQIPSQPHIPLCSEASGSPWASPPCPAVAGGSTWWSPGSTLHTASCPIYLSLSQPPLGSVGLRGWHALG